MYGENYYPRAQTLREARALLVLGEALDLDVPPTLDRLAAQHGVHQATLARVYARGVWAWARGHAEGVSAAAWGLARVLEYVDAGAAARTVDRDLAEPRYVLAPAHVEVVVSPDTVGVMLPIPLAVAEKYKLDVPGAEAPADFHMTLVYLGKLPPETLAAVRAAVAQVAAREAPFDGRISGIGRFDAPETDPLYLSVDAVRLTAFREALFAALPPSQQNHGFTPHVTLAYLPKDVPTPAVTIHDDVLHFDRVEVWVGGVREVHLLKGAPAATASPAAEGASNFDRAAASAAKAATLAWLKAKNLDDVGVGIGLGSDSKYRVELRVFSDDVATADLPTTMLGVPVNVVRMPRPEPQVGHPDAGASSADRGHIAGLVGQVEALVRETDRLPRAK